MQKIVNILAGVAGGLLLALGLSRACDRISGNRDYRYLGSGSPSRSAESRLWDSARSRIDRALDILGDGSGNGEGGPGKETDGK